MAEVGRNTPCPCGSGMKYKRCCLRRGDDIALDALKAERVWGRMQTWALDRFDDELKAALKGHMQARGVGGDERPANEEDLSLALCWMLIDREVAAGGTPAGIYSQLPELTASEREMAERIAACRLGVYRVTDSEPGTWIALENVLDGRSVRVVSRNVSRETILWHVLLCRVMEGGPTLSLWGAAAFYEPAEEAELVAELRRIADARDLGAGRAGLEASLRVGARELVCFVPSSRRAERVAYTLEGDPVVIAEATWQVREPGVALIVLRAADELACTRPTEDGEGVTFEWLTLRRELLAHRPQLPLGAICMEGGPLSVDGQPGLEDVTSLGTFTLHSDRLEFFGLSEERLDGAITLIEQHLGRIAGPPRRDVTSVQEARAQRAAAHTEREPVRVGQASGPRAAYPGADQASLAPDARLRDLTYRRWIDDPSQHFGGATPREAATRGEYTEEIERQLRSMEYHDAQDRADRRPGAVFTQLRSELGLDAERLAA
jgi:hypothetical protein